MNMNEQVKIYLASKIKYFPAEKIAIIKSKMETLTEEQFLMVSASDFKDPTVMLLVAIFVGGWGVDRFMLGDVGMGVLKLLTGGLCGLLWLIDIFSVQKKTKELNFNNLMLIL